MVLAFFIHSILAVLSVVSSVILVLIFISTIVEEANLKNLNMAPCETNIKINNLRLQCLLEYGAEVLRDVFRQRWERLTAGGRCGWEDDVANNVERLLQKYQTDKFEALPLAQQSSIESGNVGNWDLGALTSVLLQVKFPVTGEQVDRKQMTTVRDVWNRSQSSGIKESEFKSAWSRAEKALLYFGAAQTKVNAIKQGNAKDLAKMVDQNIKMINQENTTRAQDLRTQAEVHCQSGDFGKAIHALSEALELTDLSEHDVAAMRADRGQAYLALIQQQQKTSSKEFIRTNAKRAFEDGKKATACRMEWARGYFVAGQALVLLGQLDKALVQLDLALSFDPQNKQMQEARDKCDRKLRGIPEPTAAQPWAPFKPLTELTKIGNPGQEPIDFAAAIKHFKKLARTKETPAAEVALAEHAIALVYEQGLGMEAPNYKNAARHYEKGSRLGCSSASYNLGCLHYDGCRGSGAHDFGLAVGYWTLGARQGGGASPYAMRTLCQYFLDNGDGWRAKIWYGHSVANGGFEGAEGEQKVVEQKMRSLQECGTPMKAQAPVAPMLTSPQRAFVVRQYRHSVASMTTGAREPFFNGIGTEAQLTQPGTISRGTPTPILLFEMDPGHTAHYPNRILRATCIEDALPLGGEPSGSFSLLVEDKHKDVAPLKIEHCPENLEGLAFGAKIQIRDPCALVLEDGCFRILVKDANALQLEVDGSPGPRACRFCGRVDAPKPGRCSACKWAWYCGRECQEADRRALGHGMLCKLKLPNHS